MIKFFVQCLISFFTPHGKENVSPNKLMHHFAFSRQRLEDDLFVIAQLDHHVFGLPVDVPGLDGVESPGLDWVARVQIHPHQSVKCYAQKFVFLFAKESDHE